MPSQIRNFSLSILLVGFSLSASAFSICAVGDSITEGASGFTAHRVALERRFDVLGWDVEWKGSHIKAESGSSNLCEGFSGKNAEEIAENYKEHAESIVADVLLLHAGHNYNADVGTSSPAYMPVQDIVARATNAHARIIAEARAKRPNVIILYAKVITSSKLPKYSYIPALNDAIGVLGEELSTDESPVVVVDMADGWVPSSDCVSDKVHPSATGAAKMAEKWMSAFNVLIGEEKLSVSSRLNVTKDMTLMADAAFDSVTVAENATLNLNGYKLSAEKIDGKGTIISVVDDYDALAAGYERLAYIVSPKNNNSFLDTGYEPFLTDRIETKFRLGTVGENQGVFSARATTATNTFSCILFNPSGRRKLRFDHHTTNPYVFHRADGLLGYTEYTTDKDCEIVMDGNTLDLSVNGKISSKVLTPNSADAAAKTGISLRLFAVATKGSGHTLFARDCRMYYFRVYDKAGNLKLNLVPVRRKSDGKVGLFDCVGKTFKTLYSGDIVAGPACPQDLTAPGAASVVNPLPYKGSAANLFNNNFIYKSDDTHRVLVKKASVPFFVDYDFGAGKAFAVNMYRIHAAYKLRAPKAWCLYGSNNPSAYNAAADDLWVKLDECDSQTDWTLGASQDITAEYRTKFFVNDTPYRYYRFKFLEKNDASHDYAELVQLEYFRVENTGNSGVLYLPQGFDPANSTVRFGCDVKVVSGGVAVDPLAPKPVVDSCLIEAESFEDKGGWVVDPQFVEQMGSPYLLAHGMGLPVADAQIGVNIRPGRVRAWVRTRDWTPDWEGEKPGRFQLVLDGKVFPNTLGVAPAAWGWVDAGVVEVGAGPQILALHDLTGFEGRCDAIYLCPEDSEMPPNDGAELATWRAGMRGEAGAPEDVVEADFVVVGGGIAGTAAAIAAAEAGMKVAIVHDRPMLGGNASDEIRVQCAKKNSEYHWIVKAIANAHDDNGYESTGYDETRMNLAKSYSNLDLHLRWRAYGVVTNAERKIVAVDARNIETGARRRFVAPLYCDATGDGWIAYWAGAAYMLGREAKKDFDEPKYAQETADTSTMGNSLLWTTKTQSDVYEFPEVPWAVKVSGDRAAISGNWKWEAGLDPEEDTIDDAEMLRDRLFRAIYGSFYTAKKKNSDHDTRVFDWVPYIAGKRESRRIIGDYVVSEKDVTGVRKFEDAIGIATWTIDLHWYDGDSGFITDTTHGKVDPWWMPYRSLCCRDVPNLFLAGRCASYTHVAFGSSRVMNAGGQQGVAAGFAASLCKKYGCLPRGIYQDAAKTAELQKRMNIDQPTHGMSYYSWPKLEVVENEVLSVIIDNADATGVQISGDWKASSHSSNRYGANYLHNDKVGSDDLWVRFTPEMPSNATYSVSLFWNGGETRASAVPVEIVYDGGVVTQSVNMTTDSGSWNRIGEWPFANGTSGSVKIMTNGKDGKTVIVDAVKFAIMEPSKDSDQNGLYDDWERMHFLQVTGTNPDADPDADGLSNRYEFVIGSDPNVLSRPFTVDNITSSKAQSIVLTWKGVTGRIYQVKCSDTPNGTYQNYGEPITVNAEGDCVVEIPFKTNMEKAQFYKIDVSVL